MSTPVFSVHGLIAWLETQDPETTYEYTDSRDCLICRYFTARGVSWAGVIPNQWRDTDLKMHALPSGIQEVSQTGQWTYGAALARAKESIR